MILHELKSLLIENVVKFQQILMTVEDVAVACSGHCHCLLSRDVRAIAGSCSKCKPYSDRGMKKDYGNESSKR